MKYHKQETERTCGPACVKMIFSKLGKDFSEEFLIKELKSNPETGTSIENIIKFFKKSGLDFLYETDSSIKQLNEYLNKYIILIRYNLKKHEEDHYAIYKGIKNERVHLWDPRYGKNHSYSFDYFNKHWKSDWEGFEKGFFAIKKV